MQEVYMYINIDCRTLHLYLVWLKRENAKLYSFTMKCRLFSGQKILHESVISLGEICE